MRVYDEVLRDHVAMVTRAADFAARRHLGQNRKGINQEPHINHLAEVALLLASTVEEPDAFLVAAGWLHDTLEDTDTTADVLYELFGPFVADLVIEVTDDSSMLKGVRNLPQLERASEKSPSARLIKLAEETSNLRSLAEAPPAGWSAEEMAEYVRWAEAVVAPCRNLNAELERLFDKAAAAARAAMPCRAV